MVAVKTTTPCNGGDVRKYSILEPEVGRHLTGLEVTGPDAWESVKD